MNTVPEYMVPDTAVGGSTDKYRFGCRTCDEIGESRFLASVDIGGGKSLFLSPPTYDDVNEARSAAQRHQVNVHGASRPWVG